MEKYEICSVDLSPIANSERGGVNIDDRNDTITVVPMSMQNTETSAHIEIYGPLYGLSNNYTLMLEHMRTVKKSRYICGTCKLAKSDIAELKRALSANLKLSETDGLS